MSFWSGVGDGIENVFGIGPYDPSNPDRAALSNTGAGAMGLGNQGYGNYGTSNGQLQGTQQGMGATQGYLQGIANGTYSPSADQLTNSLQQNMAAQTSLAASQPGSVEALRTAANNNARMQTGLANQQQLAGMQDRNTANSLLGQSYSNQAGLQLGARGQDASGAASAYGNAAGAYGTTIQNPQKTGASLVGGGAGGLAAGAGALFSDKRLKHNIEDADDDAADMLDRLSSALSKRLATIGKA